jgi:hypothetical protein
MTCTVLTIIWFLGMKLLDIKLGANFASAVGGVLSSATVFFLGRYLGYDEGYLSGYNDGKEGVPHPNPYLRDWSDLPDEPTTEEQPIPQQRAKRRKKPRRKPASH